MTLISPVLGIIHRRGEQVWFRNISRYTHYSSGEPQQFYLDNQSTTVRIVEYRMTEHGTSMFVEKGKATAYCDPAEYWNDSVHVKINDQLIQLPANYSAGGSVIYRVDDIKRVALMNQSQYYIRLDLLKTAAKE